MPGSPTTQPERLSTTAARRTILRAQGLLSPRPSGRVDRRHFQRVIDALGVIQIDSVNVLVRAHHVPFFSRVGPHDPALLHRMAYDDRRLFEYWGHVASLIDVHLEPNLRWRKEAEPHWNLGRIAAERPELVTALEHEVLTGGPLAASDLRERVGDEPNNSPWWGWNDTKLTLEYLFSMGRLGALRRGNFERVYCAPDVALPPDVLARPTPTFAEAQRALTEVAARAHGIATVKDLADYWRCKTADTKVAVAALVEDGVLQPVDVEGWDLPAYRHVDAVTPRSADGCALVNPFDVAMWERDRIERVHGFEYRIEIYVPEPRRVYGYYSLPFLLGDTFVARVDLKADRKGRRLLVQSAHAEPDLAARGTDVGTVAERLGSELRSMADWLGLDDVSVGDRGDLSATLRDVSLSRPAATVVGRRGGRATED